MPRNVSASANNTVASAEPTYSWSVVSTDAGCPVVPPPPQSVLASAHSQGQDEFSQAGQLSMANRAQLELLTTPWVLKVRQSCCATAQTTQFPLPSWSAQQLRRVAKLSADLIISHYEEGFGADVQPLPSSVQDVMDAATMQWRCLTAGTGTSQQLVFLDLVRDGSILAALHIVTRGILSSRPSGAARESALRLILNVLAMSTNALHYAVSAGQPSDCVRDALCVAAPLSVACLGIVEGTVRSWTFRVPQGRSHLKGPASNGAGGEREVCKPPSPTEACRLCALVEDAMLDNHTMASTLHVMVRTWFNEGDNTFPTVVVRFGYQWCAVCTALAQVHSAALDDGGSESHCVLQEFVHQFCRSMCSEEAAAPETHARWPLFLIAALGARVEWPPLQHPQASLRTQAQWSTVRTGLIDVGSKLLHAVVQALLATSAPLYACNPPPPTTPSLRSIDQWQPTVMGLLQKLDHHSGSHQDAVVLVDVVLRAVEEHWVAVVSPPRTSAVVAPSEQRNCSKQKQKQQVPPQKSNATQKKSKGTPENNGSPQRAVVDHLAALLWDLIHVRSRASEALLTGDRESNAGTEQVLASLWKRMLRFHSAPVEDVVSRSYDALVRSVKGDPGRVLSIVRSLIQPPRPTPVSPATVATVRSPLAGWLGNARDADGPEVGRCIMESLRRTLRHLAAPTPSAVAAGATLDLATKGLQLFHAMGTLLRDLVQSGIHTPSRDGAMRDLVELLHAMHKASLDGVLLLSDGAWSADDFTSAIVVMTARAGADKPRPDDMPHRRGERSRHEPEKGYGRLLMMCASHVASMERALWLLHLAPAALFATHDALSTAVLELTRFVASATQSPSRRVRTAALQVVKRKGMLWPASMVVTDNNKDAAGKKARPAEGTKKNANSPAVAKSSAAAHQRPLLYLFHRMLTTFGQVSQQDNDVDACCVALSIASAPSAHNDVTGWVEATEALARKGPDAQPWQLTVGRALADEIMQHLSTVPTEVPRQVDERRGRGHEGQEQPDEMGPTAADAVELGLALLRDRRWEAEVPKELRSGFGHCMTLLAVVLSHLERASAAYAHSDASGLPACISPASVHLLHTWAPAIRHQLCDLAVFVVRHVVDPACVRFVAAWGGGGGVGRDCLLRLKQELLSLALRVGLQRMKDLRQLAAALANTTAPTPVTVATHRRAHHSQRDEVQRKRTAMCLELVKTLGEGTFLRLQWDDDDSHCSLDGHLQGVGALAARLMPELLVPPAHASTDVPSIGPFFAAVGGCILSLLTEGLLSAAEAYRTGDTTATLARTMPFSEALTDHGKTPAVVAVLVLLSEPHVRNLFIELSCAALANGEAHDERNLLIWFAQLKDDIRGALRCFKSDGLTTKSIRDAVLDSGLLTKTNVAELQTFAAHDLPAEHWGDAHQEQLAASAQSSSSPRGYRTYDLGDAAAGAFVRVRLRRTESCVVLANAVQRLHASRTATASLLHTHVATAGGPTMAANPTAGRPNEPTCDDVPDVCRDIEKLLDDSDDDDVCSAAASPHEPSSPSYDTKCDDKAPRHWASLAIDVAPMCSKRRWLLSCDYSGVNHPLPATVEALRRLTNTNNTTLLRGHRAEVEASATVGEGALLRSVAWVAVEAKIRLLSSKRARHHSEGDECIVDLDREAEMIAHAMEQLAHSRLVAVSNTATTDEDALHAAFAYSLVDWTRFSLVPTTHADPTRRQEMLLHLTALLCNALRIGAAEPRSGNAMLSWLRTVCDLCPHQHRAILQRQLASHTQNLLVSSLDLVQEGFPVTAVIDAVCRRDIDGPERAHWVARLLMRMLDADAPSSMWEEVLASAQQHPLNWTSTIAVEVAVALLCKVANSGLSAHIAESLAKLVSLSVRLPSAAMPNEIGYVPSTLFLINSLRFAHCKAFDVLRSALPTEDKAALEQLHEYCTALEVIALTPPEMSCIAANQMADEAERFVMLLQEILAEVAAPVTEEKPRRPVVGAHEELPELGAETSSVETGRDTPLTPLFDECQGLLAGLVAQLDHSVEELVDTMTRRLAPGGSHTWFDAAMWYVDRRNATDLGPALPSVHPHHRGGVLHGAMETVRSLIAGAESNLQQLRSKKDQSPAKVAAQLGEFVSHVCLMIRQDVCGTLRRAASTLRATTEQHVCTWFATEANSGDDKGCRTITELFSGNVPAILQGPIPVSFPIKGNGKTLELVQWRLDVNQVMITPSQELPRTIRFRGSMAPSEEGRRNQRRGKTFTQTFLLKGPRSSDKSIHRDRCIVILLEELQRLGQHELQQSSTRSRSTRPSTTLEQWLLTTSKVRELVEPAVEWPPRAAATMRDALWMPTYTIFPFASGGGLIEHLHGSATVAVVVEGWQKERLAAAAAVGEGLLPNQRQPSSLSLQAPLVQFNETLKSVVDELNARHQEAKSKKPPTTAVPKTAARGSASAMPPQRHFEPIDLHRPTPEALKETFLRLLRLQPSPRDVVANAIFSTLDTPINGKPNSAVHLPINSDREWVSRWCTYTRSLATGCALTYALGIGDRHLGNLLVFTEHTLHQRGSNQRPATAVDDGIGRVAHVDFAVCFGAGARLRFPERVPFRMSPVLLQPLGAYGCEGGFAEHLRQTLQSLHHNETFATELIAALYQILPPSSNASGGPCPSDGDLPLSRRHGCASLRGSLLASVDRVADRAYRQLEGLFAGAFAPSAKTPHGSCISMRHQLFVQCNLQGIASVGLRLSALVDEHRALRGEASVNAAIGVATQRLADLTTALNGHVTDIVESTSSCERTSARLGDIVRAVVQAATAESSSPRSPNGDTEQRQTDEEADELSQLFGYMLALPRSVSLVATPSAHAITEEASDSLWQDQSVVSASSAMPPSLSAITDDQTIMLLKPTAMCTSIWGPEGQHASMVDALVAMCEPEHPSQRLLRATESAQLATKLLEMCSQHSGLFALPKSMESSSSPSPWEAMQSIVQQLQDWRTNQPLSFRTDSVAAAAACDGAVAAARRLVEDAVACHAPLHEGLDLANTTFPRLPPQLGLVPQVWFETIRLDVWPKLTVIQCESQCDAIIRTCIVSGCSGRLAEAMSLPMEAVQSAVDKAMHHCSTSDSGTVSWLSPHWMGPALEMLCAQLAPAAPVEAVRQLVQSACVMEAQRMLRTLFCLWSVVEASRAPTTATSTQWWLSYVSHTSSTSAWLLEMVVEPVQRMLHNLNAVDDASAAGGCVVGCSAKARHLGEYAGLCCLPEATVVIQRLWDIVSDVVDVHWPLVLKCNADMEVVRKELADSSGERARLRQRSAVIHNEQRTLAEMLRQALSPVVLNGLSALMRHMQVAVEGLYKELQTDLLETLLPRLQQRASSGGVSRLPMGGADGRSPNQIAAQLVQRATHDCCTVLNTIHQLIVEGYEVVSKEVSRGSAGRKDDRNQGDVEIARAVHELLRVTDAVLLTASVDLFDAMAKLFAVLGGLGAPCAQQRLPRIAEMHQHTLSIASIMTARSTQLQADAASSSTESAQEGADGRKDNQHQRRRVERLVDRILASSSRGKSRNMGAAANGLAGIMGDVSAALRLGDVAQAIEETKRRLKIMSEAQKDDAWCTAPTPIKQLLRQSIDAEVLSAMYPGWTAWI